MRLIKKFKKLLNTLSTKYKYAMCYNANEGNGAIFGMCSNCNDKNCPYFVDIER